MSRKLFVAIFSDLFKAEEIRLSLQKQGTLDFSDLDKVLVVHRKFDGSLYVSNVQSLTKGIPHSGVINRIVGQHIFRSEPFEKLSWQTAVMRDSLRSIGIESTFITNLFNSLNYGYSAFFLLLDEQQTALIRELVHASMSSPYLEVTLIDFEDQAYVNSFSANYAAAVQLNPLTKN